MNRQIIQTILKIFTFILAALFYMWATNNYISDFFTIVGTWSILAAGHFVPTYFDKRAEQKARDRIPYLQQIYAEQIKDCQRCYFAMTQRKTTYVENATLLGLNHWYQQKAAPEYRQKPIEAVLKYTNVTKDPKRVERLQACIDYIEKKEKLGQSLGSLGDLLTNDLSQEELGVATALEWACEITGINRQYIEIHYFCIADPEDCGKDIMWALTAHNLTLLLDELRQRE